MPLPPCSTVLVPACCAYSPGPDSESDTEVFQGCLGKPGGYKGGSVGLLPGDGRVAIAILCFSMPLGVHVAQDHSRTFGPLYKR